MASPMKPGFYILEVKPGDRPTPGESRGWMVYEIGFGSPHGILNNIDCSGYAEKTFAKSKELALRRWKKSNSPFDEYEMRHVRIFRIPGKVDTRALENEDQDRCSCGALRVIHYTYDLDREYQILKSGWKWLPRPNTWGNELYCPSCMAKRSKRIRVPLVARDTMGKVIGRLEPAGSSKN